MGKRMNNNIKRYIFPYLHSNMYILVEGTKALVIDPHYCEEADHYLKANDVCEILIILTHEHFDHTSGVRWFQEKYKTTTICQKQALNSKVQKQWNRPTLICLQLIEQGKTKEAEIVKEKYPSYQYNADITFEEREEMCWNNHQLIFEHLPGHSPASCMIILDQKFVFTGDSLIPNIPTTTRWPGSSTKDFQQISLEKLLDMPKEAIIYPGHNDPILLSDLVFTNNYFAIKSYLDR